MVKLIRGVTLAFENDHRNQRLRLLTPSLRLKTIYDLNFNWLKSRSIKAVISDLDNTLVPWRDYTVADDLAQWFDSLHREGFRTVILTNARPSPTIRQMSKLLNTPVVEGARKPISRFFRKALSLTQTSPGESCVIGDQVFTDVLGGNIIGCHTVLVERIGNREFVGTKIMRVIEKAFLNYLDRKGI